MNNDKTQFIVCTHSQRRKSSRLSQEERRKRNEKIETEIGGEKVKEGDEVKILGVKFNSFLRFESYWKEVRAKMSKKLHGISQIKSHLNFLQRKQLASSLVISRAEYCIEATSCCTRTVLSIARRILNRTTRVITNNWDPERTELNYRALGWMEIEELVTWKTYTMARKVLQRRNPLKILRKIALQNEGEWKIMTPKKYRTD